DRGICCRCHIDAPIVCDDLQPAAYGTRARASGGSGSWFQWLGSSGCRSRPQRAPNLLGSARSLAQVYRHFGAVDAAAGSSPLYERVAVALSESDEALRAIETAPTRKRHPAMILAALNDLALAGRAPALAAAYAATDGDAAADAAIDALVRMTRS